jgi:hypothetical protein
VLDREKRNIAANQIAEKPGLIGLDVNSCSQVFPMSDATPGRRGEIAMQGAHPAKDLFEGLPPVAPTKILSNFVEMFSLDGARPCVEALNAVETVSRSHRIS